MNRYLCLVTLLSPSLLARQESTDVDYATHLHEQPHRAAHIKIEKVALLDGRSHLMDGIGVKDAIWHQQELAALLQGQLNKQTKKRVGKYTYAGKKVAVSHLAKIEQQGNLNSKEQIELVALLKEIQEEVLKALDPFAAQLSIARQYIIPIIDEWCTKRNRKESFLLRWSESAGNERDIFLSEITTFKELYYFCKDTHTFLGDLIANCPKGYQQFLDLVNKQNEQQRQHETE